MRRRIRWWWRTRVLAHNNRSYWHGYGTASGHRGARGKQGAR